MIKIEITLIKEEPKSDSETFELTIPGEGPGYMNLISDVIALIQHKNPQVGKV